MSWSDDFNPLTYEDGFEVNDLPKYFKKYNLPSNKSVLPRAIIDFYNGYTPKEIDKLISERERFVSSLGYVGNNTKMFALLSFWFEETFHDSIDLGEDGEYWETIEYYVEKYSKFGNMEKLLTELGNHFNKKLFESQTVDFNKGKVLPYKRQKVIFPVNTTSSRFMRDTFNNIYNDKKLLTKWYYESFEMLGIENEDDLYVAFDFYAFWVFDRIFGQRFDNNYSKFGYDIEKIFKHFYPDYDFENVKEIIQLFPEVKKNFEF